MTNFGDLLEEQVKDHPMECFRAFSEISEGDFYVQQMAILINELSKNVIIPVESKEELRAFMEKVDGPVMGQISSSGELGKGEFFWADPNTGNITSIAAREHLTELEEQVQSEIDQVEQDLEAKADDTEVEEIVQQSKNYEYTESMHVELAEDWWGLIDVEGFMSRTDEFNITDGGYFRDNVMGMEETAQAFASSKIAMEATFAADEMVI